MEAPAFLARDPWILGKAPCSQRKHAVPRISLAFRVSVAELLRDFTVEAVRRMGLS